MPVERPPQPGDLIIKKARIPTYVVTAPSDKRDVRLSVAFVQARMMSGVKIEGKMRQQLFEFLHREQVVVIS